MNNINWKEFLKTFKDIAELVGIAAIVASLVFVGWQIQQAQQIAMHESAWSLQKSGIEIRNAVNEAAEVWARGNAGEEVDRAEAVIYQNLIRNANSHAYAAWITSRRLGTSGEVPVHDLAGFLFEHPAARQVWEGHREKLGKYRELLMSDPYTADFATLVRADLEALSQACN